jgi:serine/threonine protein kinase
MNEDGSSKYALLDQLAEEFAERYRHGERPSLQEYIDRHPDLADDIRELFPALVKVEQAEEQAREPTPVSPPEAPPLRQVGDYRVLREVGRGGMGVVYEAEQTSLGRRVALKVLPQSVSRDDKALERFRREAKAAAKLHHTNIVPVFEVGQEGDVCFYAMQFIQGQPLDQVIDELRRLRKASQAQRVEVPCAPGRRQVAESLLTGRFQAQALITPVSEEEAAPPGDSSSGGRSGTGPAVLPGQTDLASVEANRKPYYRSVAGIGQQVGHALAYAHQRGVMHRDIKPSNLLLDASGVVWVTDFGLAKTEDSSLTEAGEILGTLRYLAPECFRSQCDVRSDLYALGLTLYELLTLRPAFDSADRLKLIETIYTQEPPRPRLLDPGIPRDLETIVLKAIDKDPARRHQTAEEVADDLRRFLADEPIKARRTSPVERLARWCRRHPAVASLSAVVAGLVLTVAVVASAAALQLSAALAESEQHRKEADKNLWDAYLAQARAGRMSRRVGQRTDSLEAIRKARALPLPDGHSLDELRNEAASCLVLPDLRPVPDARPWTWAKSGAAGRHVIDARHDRYAVADGQGNVTVRRVADDEELWNLSGYGTPSDTFLVLSPDGGLLAVLAWPQGRTKLWRLDGPEAVLLAEAPAVSFIHAVAFSPDGGAAVLGMKDGRVVLVERTNGHARTLPHQLPGLWALAWHPDGRQLAVARTDGSRHLLSVHSLDEARPRKGVAASRGGLRRRPGESARRAPGPPGPGLPRRQTGRQGAGGPPGGGADRPDARRGPQLPGLAAADRSEGAARPQGSAAIGAQGGRTGTAVGEVSQHARPRPVSQRPVRRGRRRTGDESREGPRGIRRLRPVRSGDVPPPNGRPGEGEGLPRACRSMAQGAPRQTAGRPGQGVERVPE